jgi:hypothetical protein
MATPHERLGLSRGQIDRAGTVLRRWAATGLPAGPEVFAAGMTLAAFRCGLSSWGSAPPSALKARK